MEKGLMAVLVLLMIGAFLMPVNAQEQKGGMGPCLASCCLGPRIGLEMNEGKSVETLEILGLFFFPLRSIPGFQKAGAAGGFVGCCFGPRVGAQFNERKIRTMEILQLVLVGTIMIGLEAKNGKTMTEIEAAENLKK
jgi:hypothetical protein